MPTYIYQCNQHGEFEVTQKISDPALDTCPECSAAGTVQFEFECQACSTVTTGQRDSFVKDCQGCQAAGKGQSTGVGYEDGWIMRPVRPKRLISLSSFSLSSGGVGWCGNGYSSK